MGGKNEKEVTTKAAASGQANVKDINVGAGKGRIHEDAGEVHFHDDTNKIKVAVPSYIFEDRFKRWVGSPNQSLTFLDAKNGTMVELSLQMKPPNNLEVDLLFSKVTLGNNLAKLIEHSEAR